jgi:site-specific recombinase XerC
MEALDIDDVVMSARRGKLIVRDGKGGIYRKVPLHDAARVALRAWLDAPAFPTAAPTTPDPEHVLWIDLTHPA